VTPQFSGPWQDRFHTDYSNATSTIARQILCDGVITDAEASEVNDLLRQCLVGVGFTNVDIGEYGTLGWSIPAGVDPQVASSQELQCEAETGWGTVIPLYNDVRTNPQNVDKNQLIADCLVKFGLRPAGYSAADVDAEFDGGDAFADIQNSPHFMGCWYDPLHEA